MENYVYKTNLNYLLSRIKPEFLADSMRENLLDENFSHGPTENYFIDNPLLINNVHFDYCVYIKKTGGKPGIIHVDKDNENCFAINIVYSGTTVMEFWESGLNLIKNDNDYRFGVKGYSDNNIMPSRTYTMEIGVYLVNGSVPHRAICYNDRRLLTVRSNHLAHKDWTYVKALFKDSLVLN